MSDYIFQIGDDFSSENREYVALNTNEGQLITIALTASGVPFKGRFDKVGIFFSYTGDYKDSVDEIISKITSDEYAEQRREIDEYRQGEDCLCLIPTAAKLLRMTEGTLRGRPLDIQIAVCKRYTDTWYCDIFTIQRELNDALMLRTKIE